MKMKYPRTPHLPWSRPGEDDVWMEEMFAPDTYVVVTEKLDGECTSIYSDGSIHARSIDSKDHPSRHYVKGMAAYVTPRILFQDLVLLGENVFAKHSIHYTELSSYFYLFGVRLREDILSWDEVEDWAEELGLMTAPVIWCGRWGDFKHEDIWPRPSEFGPECEGYVVRNINEFPVSEFRKNVAKFVRPNHIQTDQHWLRQPMVINGLL